MRVGGLVCAHLLGNRSVALFDPSSMPKLCSTFFTSRRRFRHLCAGCRGSSDVHGRHIGTIRLFSLVVRRHTSANHVCVRGISRYGARDPFSPTVTPIHRSGLYLRVTLPAGPLGSIGSRGNRVTLYALSTFGLNTVGDLSRLRRLTVLTIHTLSTLLSCRSCPVPTTGHKTVKHHALNVNIVGFTCCLTGRNGHCSSNDTGGLARGAFRTVRCCLLGTSGRLTGRRNTYP